MDKHEAYRILGIRSGDKLKDVRRRYHLLMHEHHPDVLEEGADDDFARKLNEAFGIIKREGISSKYQIKDWGIEENKAAYCSRKLYMEDTLFGDDIIVDTGAYGKFYWEPDMESFRMLLKSVGEAATALLDDIKPDNESSEKAYLYTKAKLLHLLMQEYIDPYESVKLLYPYVENDDQSLLTFRIKCHIKPEGKKLNNRSLSEDIQIKPQQSRLYAYSGSIRVGQIMFEEDRLYYLVTPLFQQRSVNAQLHMRDTSPYKKKVSYIPVYMDLTVNLSLKKDPTDKINKEIEETLAKFRAIY